MSVLQNKSFLSVIVAFLIFISASTLRSQAESCFPTCSSVDGRMLLVVLGPGFATLTTDTLNMRIIIPGDQTEFSFGIFDGDSEPSFDPEDIRNWDTGVPYEYSYTLKIDPDQDDNGIIVFQTNATALPNNAWKDYTLPTDEEALDENGNFVYTLTAVAEGPLNPMLPELTSNAFKIRSSGVVGIDEIFTFTAALQGAFIEPGSDYFIVYPNLDTSNGVTAEDKEEANFNGQTCFFFNIEEENVTQLDFWDGDTDRGTVNVPATFDTDDPNTPNVIPPFAPPESDVVPEGVGVPLLPNDDVDPTTGDGPFLVFQEGPPTYTLTFPDGQEFLNENPSGNAEWELFRISTTESSPNIVDFMTDVIPPGQYQLCFNDVDMNNYISLRPIEPLIFVGEVLTDPDNSRNVPTISEWGLISVALLMGVIGILVVRRRQQQVQ